MERQNYESMHCTCMHCHVLVLAMSNNIPADWLEHHHDNQDNMFLRCQNEQHWKIFKTTSSTRTESKVHRCSVV